MLSGAWGRLSASPGQSHPPQFTENPRAELVPLVLPAPPTGVADPSCRRAQARLESGVGAMATQGSAAMMMHHYSMAQRIQREVTGLHLAEENDRGGNARSQDRGRSVGEFRKHNQNMDGQDNFAHEKPKWLGTSGAHRHGGQWRAVSDLSLSVYSDNYLPRYLDPRLSPTSPSRANAANMVRLGALEMSPLHARQIQERVNTPAADWHASTSTSFTKLLRGLQAPSRPPHEAYRLELKLPFSEPVTGCKCGTGADAHFHKAGPPPPQRMSRTFSEPFYSNPIEVP